MISFMIGDSVLIRVKNNDSSFCVFKCFVRSAFADFYRVNITSKTRHGLVEEDVLSLVFHKASDCFPTDILLIEKSLMK